MSIRSLAAGLGIALVLIAGAIYHAVDTMGERATRRLAEERLSLLSDTLEATIDRFASIPGLAGESRSIARLLLEPEDAAARDKANRFLEQTSRDIGLGALFVLDMRGLTLAASNYADSTSFVGQDYSFRPYFTEALRNGRGRYYGVGVTTGKPGYFLSSRIALDEGRSGILVAKVDFSALEESWAGGGEHVLVMDADGVIFLATDAKLRYRPLAPLTPDRRAVIQQEQRYAAIKLGMPIAQDEWPQGQRAVRPIAGTPWSLMVVTPWAGRGWAPAGAAALGVMASLVLVLAFAMQRQRRARLLAERAAFHALEDRVAARTRDLAGALARLEQEILERQRIDGALHRARDELAQAAKLAAMGQAFSGLAHEINQPLSALRTYLASLRLMIERGMTEDAKGNISIMESALSRLSTLTGDLRRLSRRSDDDDQLVDLDEVATRVAALMKYRFADNGAALKLASEPGARVRGNANRLEQVVLNLVLNALDAVSEQRAAHVTLAITTEEGQAVLSVSDPGPGVPESQRGRLFEPFFTTKEDGVGLGLAISYAIVQDHGGTLEYERTPAGETRFRLALPLVPGVGADTAPLSAAKTLPPSPERTEEPEEKP